MATIRVRGETIRATGGHPFWVVRGEGLEDRQEPGHIPTREPGGQQEGRWVLACDLRTGDEVLLRNGEVVPVEFVRLDDVEERVYNFHVAELQNYAVGGCGVLVHNTNDPAYQGASNPPGAGGDGASLGPNNSRQTRDLTWVQRAEAELLDELWELQFQLSNITDPALRQQLLNDIDFVQRLLRQLTN